MALLHSPGEPGQRGGAAERTALEDIQLVWHLGDSPGPWGCRKGRYHPAYFFGKHGPLLEFSHLVVWICQ